MRAFAKNAERVVEDMRNIVRHTEGLIRAVPGELSVRQERAQERLHERVQNARETCGVMRQKWIARAKYADRKVHASPYRYLAGALAAGLLVGIVARRQS